MDLNVIAPRYFAHVRRWSERCARFSGLVIYPIYDYLGIELDKPIYSQIW
jgi:hypothetical protein